LDFFVSYTGADQAWAEWIAYVLEEEEYRVVIQAWDFRPGGNFVLEMQRAASTADRTIAVLSPEYLTSGYAAAEWASALAQDPQGIRKKLLPVMVRHCEVPGLLTAVVRMDLENQTEAAARKILTDGVNKGRAKPAHRPTYPGAQGTRLPKYFPGNTSAARTASQRAFMPNLKTVPSDADKRKFIRKAFDTIKAHFESGLSELEAHSDSIETDFQLSTSIDFTAEAFLNGKKACRSRIWQGGMLSSDGISIAEGYSHFGGNSCNETLSLVVDRGELFLSSMMGVAINQAGLELDLKRLSMAAAAAYLWRRFLLPFER
jgi:hypothetical protein